VLCSGGASRESAAVEADGMRSDAVRDAYARYLPLVHRFVIAELDCVAASRRGIGRISDSDAPPRLATLFSAQAEQPEVREMVGPWVERLILTGFLVEAAGGGCPPGPRDRESAWAALLLRLWESPACGGSDSGEFMPTTIEFISTVGKLLYAVSCGPAEADQPGPAMLRLLEGYAEPRTYREAERQLGLHSGTPERDSKIAAVAWPRPHSRSRRNGPHVRSDTGNGRSGVPRRRWPCLPPARPDAA
jgi:hypothetical protein